MTYKAKKSVPQRLTGLAVVVGFHVMTIYFLASGLGATVLQVVTGPIETRIIEEPKTQDKEPPPPPPKLETPPPFVPPPDFVLTAEPVAQAATTGITTTSEKPVAAAPVAKVTPPQIDPKHPRSQPPYPPISQRMNEQGTVVLAIYILADGQVGDVRVEKSSGFPRLDDAALREARRWKFLPGVSGGAAVAAWAMIPVKFELTR